RGTRLTGQGLARAPKLGGLRLDAAYARTLLRHISMLKLSEEEAEVLGNPSSLLVPEVVVTHGSRGSTLYINGRPERVPAFPLPAEPTGAGDAFSIAYVAARSIGTARAAAAGCATAVGGAVLGAGGARGERPPAASSASTSSRRRYCPRSRSTRSRRRPSTCRASWPQPSPARRSSPSSTPGRRCSSR